MHEIPIAIIEEINNNPIDKKEFVELFKLSIKALSGEIREIPHKSERVFDKPGIYLTDHPMNQMGFAILRKCNNRLKSQSFLMRQFAVQKLIHENKLGKFYIESENGFAYINDAVLWVAATLPLDKSLHFNEHDFISKVEEEVKNAE